MSLIYRTAAEIDFRLEDVPPMNAPRKVLFTRPDYFDVEYSINPHMDGNLGTVDREKALDEWSSIVGLYEALGANVVEIPGVSGLPDMVFCANQTLPFMLPETGDHGVVLSRMHAPQRAPEVHHYANYFESTGYQLIWLPDSIVDFEGMGDAIWHPGRYLLWGGYGFRSSVEAYEKISERIGVRVVTVRLTDPDFYHLDTCLSALTEDTALIFRGAFDADGLKLLQSLFRRVLYAPEDEARNLFACNAHCFDGRNVIIQAGCSQTISVLRREGFNPIEVRTDEYLKAGGSVFCMKQMFW